MYTQLSVGQKLPFFEKEMAKINGQDGCLFEAMEMGQGYMCTLFLNHPNLTETSKQDLLNNYGTMQYMSGK